MPSPLREQIAHATAAEFRALLGKPADYPADLLPWDALHAIEERAAVAERLRLHTQLRHQITALRRPEPARIGSESWSQLAARALRWEGENDMLDRVLLGVAATPQPEEHP